MRYKIAVPLIVLLLACGGEEPRVDHLPDAGRSEAGVSSDSQSVVLFLGTSLTAGLGVQDDESFPAVVGRKIDSAGIGLSAINAGESGGTTAGGLRRIDLLLEQYDLAALVLELGANDGLRGLDIDAMRTNLRSIIDKTLAAYPEAKIVVAGMEAPPNLGDQYTADFREVFSDIAEQYDAALIPFLLDGVAAMPEMNQDDGIHPNARGHERVAENVWEVLSGVVTANDPPGG